jgi:hypothetical protein
MVRGVMTGVRVEGGSEGREGREGECVASSPSSAAWVLPGSRVPRAEGRGSGGGAGRRVRGVGVRLGPGNG